MKKPLTKLQNKLLAFIKLKIESVGYQPSIYEMSKYFDVYPTAIINHLKLIEKKGYIKLTGKARAVEILNLKEK